MEVINDLKGLFKRDKNFGRSLALMFVSGSSVAILLRLAQRQADQQAKRKDVSGDASVDAKKATAKKTHPKVDAIFLRRLLKILKLVFPSLWCKESGLLALLSALLVSRTAFSLIIAEIIGHNASSIVSRRWDKFGRGLVAFCFATVPAAFVNAALKWTSQILALSIRRRLSDIVMRDYLEGVNFYKACACGIDDRIEHADQRVTADIAQFSTALAELYGSVFKPLLDVVVLTSRLISYLGVGSPVLMYAYFAFSSILKQRVVPSFGRFTARESELEGVYRTAQHNVVVNAEEIAFYGGAERERTIIARSLRELVTHVFHFRTLKLLSGSFDQLLLKYWASIAGYGALVYAIIYNPSMKTKSTDQLTSDYVRTANFLTGLANAVGDLVLSGNKLQQLSGLTSRVSELLEAIEHLRTSGQRPFEVRDEEQLAAATAAAQEGSGNGGDDDDDKKQGKEEEEEEEQIVDLKSMLDMEFLNEWRSRCDARDAAFDEVVDEVIRIPGGGRYEISHDNSGVIEFKNVDVVSPDGKLLVHNLCFSVKKGENTMVRGPNGCGKSSLFRVLCQLWPLHSGIVRKPPHTSLVFIPQKPYLSKGTLRDQLIYPHSREQMRARKVTDDDLKKLLQIVDPAQLILNEWAFDDSREWTTAFSGGQKQRVAMARLFYHRATFGVLDEATSAVSDEVEGLIYEVAKQIGITLFTVSHRASLRQFHRHELTIEGDDLASWRWDEIDQKEMAFDKLPKLTSLRKTKSMKK